MDDLIPSEMAGVLADNRLARMRKAARYRIHHGGREVPVLELHDSGFVIEADGRPPLRGYTDIFLGDERILHGLVVCTWARDGLVGYEFKRDTMGAEIRADHAPPTHAGLLDAPT